MKQKFYVLLNSIKAVTNFVEVNSIMHIDVQVHITDTVTVSGDSIMGLFSANLLKPLKIDVEADEDAVKKLLAEYNKRNITVYKSYKAFTHRKENQ